MKIAFYTLGCKTNQYETQAMERLLCEQGHEICSFEDDCDCYIVNTCSVTAVADKKNRAIIRRCRRKHPQAILGVCGCYSQHAAQAVRELEADVVGGSGGRQQFLEDLLAAAQSRTYQEHLDNALRRRDLPGKPPVWLLIAEICKAVPHLRIRLGSLEPRIVTEEFAAALSGFQNLCPQFHLSMQSGCDTVLARMKRKYTTEEYMESLERLRNAFPGCAITTDMIVGFPGETEEEFEKSLSFIRQCRFADMHIFPYSRRPGTPAAEMPGQLPNAVKEERSRRAIAVAQDMSRCYHRELLGTTQAVLVEGMEGEHSVGHAMNYVKIYIPGAYPRNEIQTVAVKSLYGDGVTGEVIQ